jgi:hypothetical protein
MSSGQKLWMMSYSGSLKNLTIASGLMMAKQTGGVAHESHPEIEGPHQQVSEADRGESPMQFRAD